MRTTQWGFDEGERKFLTHVNTPTSAYPVRNQRDSVYSSMYITDVVPRNEDGVMVELTCAFKGIISPGAQQKPRVLPGADTQMFQIGALSSGKSVNLIAPVPKDVCTYEYVTTTPPTRQGVSQAASGPFLGAIAGFSISFVADPDAPPPPINYFTGWILGSRSWEDIASTVWIVREQYGYYYNIAV